MFSFRVIKKEKRQEMWETEIFFLYISEYRLKKEKELVFNVLFWCLWPVGFSI